MLCQNSVTETIGKANNTSKHTPIPLSSSMSPNDEESGASDFHAKPSDSSNANSYWSKSLLIVGFILTLWAFVSLGCGIVFRDFLDSAIPNVGGAPFGFWMAQQGAIIGFLVLLFLYMVLMNGLDRKHGFGEDQ